MRPKVRTPLQLGLEVDHHREEAGVATEVDHLCREESPGGRGEAASIPQEAQGTREAVENIHHEEANTRPEAPAYLTEIDPTLHRSKDLRTEVNRYAGSTNVSEDAALGIAASTLIQADTTEITIH